MGIFDIFHKSVSIKDSGLLSGYADFHSHILPGVDDGVKTLDDSLKILSFYSENGVGSLWLTPHIMEDVPNTPEKLRAGFDALCSAFYAGKGNPESSCVAKDAGVEAGAGSESCRIGMQGSSGAGGNAGSGDSGFSGRTAGCGPDNQGRRIDAGGLCNRFGHGGSLKLHLAAEYMLDGAFDSLLEKGDLLSYDLGWKHLLVETSCFSPPADFYGKISRIRERGYFPLLAHPERYLYMSEEDYSGLKESGVKFQLNLPSIAGMYGRQVRSRAEFLLRKGWYEFSGSDTHGMSQLRGSVERPLPHRTIELLRRLVQGS